MENSLTSRFISSTSLMMTRVHSSKTSPSSPSRSRYLRLSLWAESWMGVSGFFTSWAIRRATSRQAAMRSIFCSWVRSSNTTTMPMYSPLSPCRNEAWPMRVSFLASAGIEMEICFCVAMPLDLFSGSMSSVTMEA